MNVIAHDLKLSHSTVSTILEDRERIYKDVKGLKKWCLRYETVAVNFFFYILYEVNVQII